jgi:hypothetical protein
MNLKLVALVVFDNDSNPNAAAEELRQAGYEIFYELGNYGGRLVYPTGDFIEVRVDIARPEDPEAIFNIARKAYDEVDAIACRHGGVCAECGLVEIKSPVLV